jgi:hypothetical protein
MSETLKERLENLRMFLCELANTEFNRLTPRNAKQKL